MSLEKSCILVSAGFAALCAFGPGEPLASAAVAPTLGSAYGYVALGANPVPTSGTVTCTGSTVNGDVGSTFNAITNTGCTITGTVAAPVAASVVTDFGNAFGALDTANAACDGVIPTTSTTLPPGVYCSAAGTTLGAGVILTLNGNASDVWVFKIGTGGTGALTANSAHVVMGGTALPCNVYWRTAQAATLTDSNFLGSILAGTSVTLTGGTYLGRALAAADVTITDEAPMTFAGCGAPSTITVNKDFLPDSLASVSIALTCSSGTVIATPLNASEALPAIFTVGGESPGTTCTATETVPLGYAANQTGCANVTLGGDCTVINALLPPVVAIPTLSGWALLALAGALGALGLRASRTKPGVAERHA